MPEIKITKERLIDEAVGLIRESGAQALNARALAKRAGVSTQPIFSHFAGMQDLKNACLQKAVALYGASLQKEIAADPAHKFRAMGLGYIRFAREEKELFRWLFMRDAKKDPLDLPDVAAEPVQVLRDAVGLSREDAERFHLEMWVVVHGIATMIVTGTFDWDEEKISMVLGDLYRAWIQKFTSREGR